MNFGGSKDICICNLNRYCQIFTISVLLICILIRRGCVCLLPLSLASTLYSQISGMLTIWQVKISQFNLSQISFNMSNGCCKLANYKVRGNSLHKTALTSDTSCKFRGPQDHSQVQQFIRRAHRTKWKLLYSQLEFSTGKGCKLKSAMGRSV